MRQLTLMCIFLLPLLATLPASAQRSADKARPLEGELLQIYLRGDLDAAIEAAKRTPAARSDLLDLKRRYERGLSLLSESQRREGAELLLSVLETDRRLAGPESRFGKELRKKLERKGKQLYEEAYIIKNTNPEKALDNLDTVMRITHPSSIFHQKARRLKARLGSPSPEQQATAAPRRPAESRSPSLSDEARALAEAGHELQKAGRYAEAIELFQRAYQKHPREHELLRFMGTAYAQKGDREKAYRAYKKYVKVCPKCPFAPPIRRILKDYEDWNEK
ncbi:MAG: tetratricopeptide repeat protein [Deltaproteobacteria bacterium]|nr:tetratricopeptide repeat protein [Deltaproteobacteria bacterium]